MKRKRLYENSIIFAPEEQKSFFLAYRNEYPDADFKVLTLEETEKLFFYSYDDRALVYLLKKGYNYDYSSKLLKVLSKMKPNHSYKDFFLHQQESLFLELLEKGLLYNFSYPEEFFKGRNLVVSGYGSTSYLSTLLKDLPNIALSFDDDFIDENRRHSLLTFEDLHDELHYICLRIMELLEKGVDPSLIYLCMCPSSFYDELEIFKQIYNIPFSIPSTLPIFTLPYVKKAYEYLSNKETVSLDTLNEAIELTKEYQSSPSYNEFASSLFSLFDEELDKNLYLSSLKARLKEKKRKNLNRSGTINVSSSFFAPKGSYAFYFCFSSKDAYKSPKEDGLFLDSMKKELGVETSLEQGKRNKANLLYMLKSNSIKDICIPFYFLDTSFYISPLKEELKMDVINNPTLNYEYSSFYALFELESLKEKKNKYLIDSPRINSLSRIAQGKEKYDHRFKPFLIKNESKRFSYSSLTEYINCPFSYYCDKVLKLSEYEETNSILYGNIAHGVLSKIYEPNFDFDLTFKEELGKIEEEGISSSTGLVLNLAYPYIKKTYESVKDYDSSLSSPSFKTEFSLTKKYGDNSLYGRVDKSIIFGDDTKYYFIIDYKTGSAKFNKDDVQYGMSMQLPIYYILASNSPIFEKAKPAGLFIATIKDENTFDNDESKASSLFSLNGVVTTDDIFCLGDLDYIQGIKLKKDGTLDSNSLKRIVSSSTLDEIKIEAENVIEETMKNVSNSIFDISPLSFKGKSLPCDYCSYSDICFHKENDKRILPNDYVDASSEKEEED